MFIAKYYAEPTTLPQDETWVTLNREAFELTGGLRELAAAEDIKQYSSSKLSVAITREEVERIPYFITKRSSDPIDTISESVLVFLTDITELSPAPRAAIATVYEAIPDADWLLFPIALKQIDFRGCRQTGHHVCGIVRPLGAEEREVMIWDPNGDIAINNDPIARAVAAAFNSIGHLSKRYRAIEAKEGDDKTLLEAAPQAKFGKNGYCQTWTYLKIRDLFLHGYPGKLVTTDHWTDAYQNDLGRIHEESVRLCEPEGGFTVKRDDMSPRASYTTWTWLPPRYHELGSIGARRSPFAILSQRQKGFNHYGERPPLLGWGVDGTKLLGYTVEKEWTWNVDSPIPDEFWTDDPFVSKVAEYATMGQVSTLVKAFLLQPRKLKAECLQILLTSDTRVQALTRLYARDLPSEQRRLVITETVRKIKTLPAGTQKNCTVSFYELFCSNYWARFQTKVLAFRELMLFGDLAQWLEFKHDLRDVSYYALSDDELNDPTILDAMLKEYDADDLDSRTVVAAVAISVELALVLISNRPSESFVDKLLPKEILADERVIYTLLSTCKYIDIDEVVDDLDEKGITVTDEIIREGGSLLDEPSDRIKQVVDSVKDVAPPKRRRAFVDAAM